MLQSVTSWNCVSCIFSVSFGGVWLSFCLRLMFLASSGVYLKIRRFAATWHIESEIFLSFGSSPSHGTEIAIFDFTLSFSPSLLILFSNIVHGDARKASGSHNKGTDYLRRAMACRTFERCTLHSAIARSESWCQLAYVPAGRA